MQDASTTTPIVHPRRRRTAAMALVTSGLGLALLLGGCGEEAATESPDTGATSAKSAKSDAESIWGRRFTTDQITLAGEAVNLAEPGLTLDFSAPDRVTAHAGCNAMSANAELDGTRLSVGDIVMTEMACADPLQRNDQLTQQLLASPLDVSVDGDSVKLSGASASATFRAADAKAGPVDDEFIQGPAWFISTLVLGDIAVAVPAEAADATLTFNDGQLSMQLCNAVNARYRLDGDVLHVSDVASTKKLCASDVNTMESDVLSILQDSPTMSLDGDRLVLASGEGPDATQIVLTR